MQLLEVNKGTMMVHNGKHSLSGEVRKDLTSSFKWNPVTKYSGACLYPQHFGWLSHKDCKFELSLVDLGI